MILKTAKFNGIRRTYANGTVFFFLNFFSVVHNILTTKNSKALFQLALPLKDSIYKLNLLL